MIEIKDLLAKYEKLLFSEEAKRDLLRNAILDVTGIEIEPEDIRIKKGTVYLDIKPIYKSEILLKREDILSKIDSDVTLL